MKKLKDINILFLEDDIHIRKNYAFVLREMCKNIYEASNYSEAYDKYNTNHIDIIIADLNLNTKKTGIDFLKYVREKNYNIKIIVISAYSCTDYLFECTTLNLIKYLLKPLKRDALFEAIDKAVKEINDIKIISSNKLYISENITWDYNMKELFYQQEIIKFTKTEKEILNTILSNPSIELTYENILFLSNLNENMNIETLRTMVYNIRKKLPEDFIKTIYGVGYKCII